MFTLFQTLFNLVGVKYTDKYLSAELKDIPYPNSMYGIGVVLAKYNMDYQCLRFNPEDKIGKVSLGIIIYKGVFAIASNLTDEDCTLIIGRNKKLISLKELWENWNGVVMIVDKRQSSGETDYHKHRDEDITSKIKTIGCCGGFIVAIVMGIILHFHVYNIILGLIFIVNILGIFISYLLLQKQLHIKNRFADKLCGLAKESHCEDVTQSDGATFLGLFKLSEIGASFFGVNLLALIFAPQYATTLSVIAAIVLPFSFWSIWYQKVKAKSWCVLCLLTLALMWIQAGLYLAGGYYVWDNSLLITLALLGAGYVITVILINRVMWLIEQKRKKSIWKGEFNYLKSQTYVIDAYLKQKKHFNVSTEDCSSLYFGDEDAPRLITVFSNPYCSPCALMHKRIEGYPGKTVRIQYVMTYFSSDRSIINKYIIAAYQQLGAERTWKLLSDWYEKGKQQGVDFFASLKLDITTKDVANEFEKQQRWREDKKLHGTPTVMVNGAVIEYPYEVSDYMLFPYEN